MTDEIVIAAARRTPIGAFQGALAPVSAPDLGATAAAAAIEDCGVKPEDISEVIFGCVLPAGLGQAPARQAALAAGLPSSVGCTTINKVCGSGMKAVMLAHDLIRAGSADIVLAGGMESMSNAPYLLPKARQGLRMGHQEILDHMFLDGLQNPYDNNMMGHFAEQTVDRYQFTREDQDAFATASVRRALEATQKGLFDDEIVPVLVRTRRNETRVDKDEEPFRCELDKIPEMRPAFRRDGGTVTAASSSSISDGAAALVITSAATAEEKGLDPIARIVAHSGFAHAPEWFTTAPVFAIEALQNKLGWTPDDVDLYEINEAFAVVAMAAIRDLELDHSKVNVNGGACALGHPIGATGARLLVTLVHGLRNRGQERGIASLCIGGGEATAVAVEML
ncbi:MAG: acetyl-CoA C-acyltransferase [Gammaproteobacteria bacterium]|jgi:acetyl-CoA C-acetyltransferase|nr:MAG: acetyl-CoA acetyltransferase [Gammaproteobacteria bacterium SG8_31]